MQCTVDSYRTRCRDCIFIASGESITVNCFLSTVNYYTYFLPFRTFRRCAFASAWRFFTLLALSVRTARVCLYVSG